MPETIRGNIADAINELNKLLLRTDNPAEMDRIRKLRRIYFTIFEEVIEQELDKTTNDYNNAIEGLKKATAAAVQAQEDIARISEAIDQAARAISLVDKVVKVGLTVFSGGIGGLL